MNTSTRNWENYSYIILVVSLLTFGGDFSLKSVKEFNSPNMMRVIKFECPCYVM